MTDTTTATPGIDVVAATVVEHFLALGGDMMVEDKGRLHVWFPEPGVGRRDEQPDLWARGHTDGAYRALWSLIDDCKPLRAAVKEYIRRWPSKTYGCGGVEA